MLPRLYRWKLRRGLGQPETRETLDGFIHALREIDREITENPDLVRQAPHTTPVSRLDEAKAARQPDLRWRRGE